MRTPSALAGYLERRATLASTIAAGLRANLPAFSWGQGEAGAKGCLLADFGIRLVTVSGAKKFGHEIKPGLKPIGSRYFGAPIQQQCDLYVFGVQTRPIVRAGR
jgi:hypothetical protein